MRFDTFLKIGSYVADIWRHESFQEMSKMVHKGVKRRMDNYDPYYDPYYRQFPSHQQHQSARQIPQEQHQNQQSDKKQMLLPQQQLKKNLGELITPESIQSAFQLHQTVKKFFNQTKK